jgi:methionyl-tRNA formyltransferase
VLARYMQILSDGFCARYPGQIINIHHSLLPSFTGAKSCHRAYERGVKLIGATAHYETADVDEGPIIEQGVQSARHNSTLDELVVVGQQIEASGLASAVPLHRSTECCSTACAPWCFYRRAYGCNSRFERASPLAQYAASPELIEIGQQRRAKVDWPQYFG